MYTISKAALDRLAKAADVQVERDDDGTTKLVIGGCTFAQHRYCGIEQNVDNEVENVLRFALALRDRDVDKLMFMAADNGLKAEKPRGTTRLEDVKAAQAAAQPMTYRSKHRNEFDRANSVCELYYRCSNPHCGAMLTVFKDSLWQVLVHRECHECGGVAFIDQMERCWTKTNIRV